MQVIGGTWPGRLSISRRVSTKISVLTGASRQLGAATPAIPTAWNMSAMIALSQKNRHERDRVQAPFPGPAAGLEGK
jgi:hypothetical protein